VSTRWGDPDCTIVEARASRTVCESCNETIVECIPINLVPKQSDRLLTHLVISRQSWVAKGYLATHFLCSELFGLVGVLLVVRCTITLTTRQVCHAAANWVCLPPFMQPGGSQSVYLVVSYIGGPPVPYNYETSVMIPTYLILRLGFLRKCKGRVSVLAWTHNS